MIGFYLQEKQNCFVSIFIQLTCTSNTIIFIFPLDRVQVTAAFCVRMDIIFTPFIEMEKSNYLSLILPLSYIKAGHFKIVCTSDLGFVMVLLLYWPWDEPILSLQPISSSYLKKKQSYFLWILTQSPLKGNTIPYFYPLDRVQEAVAFKTH